MKEGKEHDQQQQREGHKKHSHEFRRLPPSSSAAICHRCCLLQRLLPQKKKPEPGTGGGEWGAPGTRAGGGGRGHNATGKIRLSSIPLQLAIVGRQLSYLSTASTGKVTSKLLKVYLPLGCRDGKVTSNR